MVVVRELCALLHALRLIDQNDRVLREIIGDCALAVKKRQQPRRIHGRDALFEGMVGSFKPRLFAHGAHAGFPRLLREHNFRCGRYHAARDILERTLACRVVSAHGVDLIAKEFNAHRQLRRDRKKVEVAAAKAELPPPLAKIDALVARIHEGGGEAARVGAIPGSERAQRRKQGLRGRHALQERLR